MKRAWAATILLSLCTVWLYASHVVGGNMGYTYLGPGANGTFRYKLTLTTYTDCSPSSEIPVPVSSVNIGVYFHQAANPGAAKTLKQSLTAPLVTSTVVTPPLPPGCSVGIGTCIYKAVYETEVSLEASADGYHIYYERCCRNTALINIQNPSQTSSGFYAFIPPTSLPNSSPVFLDDPVPLICVQDSLYLLNTAVDPDGDMLLYQFATPYAGFADIFNPAPQPQPFLSWPITPVTYQGGFSSTLPFGPGSYTYINALNGVSVYKTSLTGNFAVAVEIREYRNGILIATTRRDMQVIGVVCPVNQAPVGNFSSGLNVRIVEGDTTCFDFSYTDPETDSVFLQVGGEPFMAGNTAQFSQHYTGPTSVEGKVCWTPPCGSARALPYFITYAARDNGCTPKERVNVMQITVVPDTADLHILGNTLVCGLQSAVYHTDKTSGTFHWTVTGGTLAQPANGPSASVQWNLAQGQQGTLTVVRDGPCTDDTATVTVTIAPPRFAGYLHDIWLCPGLSDTLHAEPGGSHYAWTPPTWLDNPSIAAPVTHPPDSITYRVTYRDSAGCEKFDSLLVAVDGKVPTEAGNPVSVCAGLPVILGGSPTGPAEATFQWTPGIFLPDATVPNPTLPTPQSGWYTVRASVDTCHGTDSVLVTVFALPDVDAGNDTSVCAGSPLQLNGTAQGTVNWFAAGAVLGNTQVLHPGFTAPPGTYLPVLTATSAQGCTASDTVEITVLPLPDVSISGNLKLCRGDSTWLAATGAQQYAWHFPGYLSDPFQPLTQVYSDTSARVYVTGTDVNGCTSSDSATVYVFRGFLSASSPDTVLCLGEHITLTFTADSSVHTFWVPGTYLDTDQGPTVVSTPGEDITYLVYATDASGCVDSAQVSLAVKPLPQLDITYESKLFCEYVEVTLASTNASDSLKWLLGGIVGGQGQSAVLHLDPKHPETVYLTATTAFGCKDTLALHPDFSTLEQLLPADFPNIITPNDDQVNDRWNPILPDGFAGCIRLSVFNRWGATVFDSRDYPVNWNGKTAAGAPLTDGVYFYVLEIGGIYKKGTVTIAR